MALTLREYKEGLDDLVQRITTVKGLMSAGGKIGEMLDEAESVIMLVASARMIHLTAEYFGVNPEAVKN